MCTLTLVRLPHEGYRLAFNRDESRDRPAALPPAFRACGARSAIMPVDPLAGGTWIGVNEAGLTAALLNRYHTKARPGGAGRATRGDIIPSLLACGSLQEAMRAAAGLDAGRVLPFRLCVTDGRRTMEVLSNGASASVRMLPMAAPILMTSSGLGDGQVEGPRRRLFEARFSSGGDLRLMQDSFHRNHRADQPHLSVCMRRKGAATVSHTIVEVGRAAGEARMIYHPGPPDEAHPRSELRLDLAS